MRTFKKILLILSPIPVAILSALIWKQMHKGVDDLAAGVYYIMIAVIGVLFIGIVGVITSFLFRNNPQAEKRSMYGYLVAAILVWIAAIFPVFIP